MSKKHETKFCAVAGCGREATHICYLARDKGLIPHPYVCETHLDELPCSYFDLYETKREDHVSPRA